MSGAKSHRKGKKFEQHLCHVFSPVWPNIHTRRAGGETLDHAPGRDFLETEGACIQAKCRARHDTWADMRQLLLAARYDQWWNSEEIPILVMRRTGLQERPGQRAMPDLAVVPVDCLVAMLVATHLLDIGQQEELARRLGVRLEPDGDEEADVPN